MIAVGNGSLIFSSPLGCNLFEAQSTKVGFVNFPATTLNCRRSLTSTLTNLAPIKANGGSRMSSLKSGIEVNSNERAIINNSDDSSGSSVRHEISTKGKRSTNIVWHKCSVEKIDRQELLQQKGCVIWITGLSGSGKSTLACALTRGLHSGGKLTYVLDGDNVRHGLNRDLTFKPEDRAENIRRIGEVAKLFSDAGIICIASVISPYRSDRDAIRSMLPDGDFIEVFMDTPLGVCEARDPKGLYKLARAGKIKGFTGVDDPYEPPLNCEIVLEQEGDKCPSPEDMAEKVICYLDVKGYLNA
ncbi:hypothetical protein LXL04_024399 [Taraxacum kok-saghyz]